MIKRFGISLWRTTYQFCFSNEKKLYSLQLSRQLLANYKQYQPWKNIRVIHTLTMARFDPQMINSYRDFAIKQDERQIHIIINQLSSQLNKLPHKEINILLKVLKQRSYRYNKDLSIFRALNKQSKQLFGAIMNTQMLPMSIFYLKSLGLPKLTIIKIFDQIADLLDKLTFEKKEYQKISLQTTLSILTICLEEPYIPLPITKRILTYVLTQNPSSLDSLCSLYHISSILRECLNRKVDYQSERVNARQILFNPYSNFEEAENVESQEQKADKQSEHYASTKKKLSQISEAIQKIFIDEVDIKKLQQSIVNSVQADLDPYSKKSMLYTCSIRKLRPYVEKFVTQNLSTLTPVEIMHFAKSLKDIGRQLIDQYMKKMSQIMNIQEKCYIYLQCHQHFHQQITFQLINDLIKEIDEMNYSQFIAISKLSQKLSKNQHHLIKQILVKVRQKMPADSRGQENQQN